MSSSKDNSLEQRVQQAGAIIILWVVFIEFPIIAPFKWIWLFFTADNPLEYLVKKGIANPFFYLWLVWIACVILIIYAAYHPSFTNEFLHQDSIWLDPNHK